MKIKKHLKLAIITTTMLSALAFPMAANAEPAEETVIYEKKEVTAFLYDKDTKTSMELVFRQDLPTIPYIDAADFLNVYFKSGMTEKEQADGTILVSKDQHELIVDTEKDNIYCENLEGFFEQEAETSDYNDVNFMEEVSQDPATGTKPTTLNLAAYDIDLLKIDGKAYFPLPTLSDLFSPTYNGTQYLNGNLYFFHTTDLLGGERYYPVDSLYEKLERDPAEVKYAYNELCFLFDNLYGAPAKAELAQVILEKGLDAALDTSDYLKKTKQLLKSENNAEYMLGLCYLGLPLNDGGHTLTGIDILKAMDTMKDTALIKEVKKSLENEENLMVFLSFSSILERRDMITEEIGETRDKAFSKNYQLVKSWNDTESSLYVSGDTAVFVFDDFEIPIVEHFKWAVDYAAEKGLRNFVVDLSTNGGGVFGVGGYMLTLMKNRNCNSNEIQVYTYSRISDMKTSTTVAVDLNLDGVINEEDRKVGYDLNFAILDSNASFSSANSTSVMAKEMGIAILGETSGGGECSMIPAFLSGGYFFIYSGYAKEVSQSGLIVDNGATPDYQLVKGSTENGDKDYSEMFDPVILSRDIHEFYGDSSYANEWVKGVWYDGKGQQDAGRTGKWKKNSKGWWFEDGSGWYAKNSWQKIDGKWYYFGKDGYMEKNAYRYGYRLTSSGAWDGQKKVPGWKKDKNGWWWYSLGKGTYPKNSWLKIDGKWYYFQAGGYMIQDSFIDGYWLNSSGAMTDFARCSWHKNKKGWWYGNANGWYATGTCYIDCDVYNFEDTGYLTYK